MPQETRISFSYAQFKAVFLEIYALGQREDLDPANVAYLFDGWMIANYPNLQLEIDTKWLEQQFQSHLDDIYCPQCFPSVYSDAQRTIRTVNLKDFTCDTLMGERFQWNGRKVVKINGSNPA